MWHNVWQILPYFFGVITAGTALLVLAVWATTAAEDHDDWLFWGGAGEDGAYSETLLPTDQLRAVEPFVVGKGGTGGSNGGDTIFGMRGTTDDER